MTYFEKIRQLYQLPQQEICGFSETDLEKWEEQQQIHLPETLRTYYLSLGKHEAINYSHNRLLRPGPEIGFSQDGYLVFYEENQRVMYWGIKKEDLHNPNPPVYANYSGDEWNPDWHLELPATDACLLMLAIYNGVLGGLKYNANYLDPVDDTLVQHIEQNWQQQPDISHAGQKIYTRDYEEVISLSFDAEEKCSGIFIGSANPNRFNNLLDQLELDWHYISTEDEEDEEDDE